MYPPDQGRLAQATTAMFGWALFLVALAACGGATGLVIVAWRWLGAIWRG